MMYSGEYLDGVRHFLFLEVWKVYMRYNYEKAIDNLGGTILQEFEKYFIVEYDSLHFKVFKKLVRNGDFTFDNNFRACLSKDELLQKTLKDKNKNNLDFSKSTFKGVKENTLVICPERGEFYGNVYKLLRGSGCSKCYNKYEKPKVKNKGLERFKEQASKRFFNKFDYSKSVYVNTMTKLIITCPMHGDFEQTPNEHLQAKYGCNVCATHLTIHRMEDYATMCESGAYIYIVNLYNKQESFFKIGITKNIEKRFKVFKSDGYEVGENLIKFFHDAGFIFLLEKDLHNYYYSEKYVPKTNFGGKTECFSFVDFEFVNSFLDEMFLNYKECHSES